jgi:hypothetical protein
VTRYSTHHSLTPKRLADLRLLATSEWARGDRAAGGGGGGASVTVDDVNLTSGTTRRTKCGAWGYHHPWCGSVGTINLIGNSHHARLVCHLDAGPLFGAAR